MATYQELRTRSQQVRDEQNIGGNTALRVGQLLMDIVKYFNDNDAAASEYLQQHFAMVNDGTHLLNWQQSPIVILHTMGETYDEGDFSSLSQGENYYRNGFIVEANGQGGGIHGETPKANVLYVNLANDTLYTWNGSSFDAITSGGGGGSISGDDILKNAYYLNGNLVLVFDTENGDKTVSIPVNFDASNYVPTSRTINGKALSNNITLSQSDIPGLVAALAAKVGYSDDEWLRVKAGAMQAASAVPNTTTVNGKRLNDNITIQMADIPGLLQAIANAGSGAVSVTTNQDGTFVIHVGETDYTINLNHTHEGMAKLVVDTAANLPDASEMESDTIYGELDDGEIATIYLGGYPFYGGGGGASSGPVLRRPADGATIDMGQTTSGTVSKTINVKGKSLTQALIIQLNGTGYSFGTTQPSGVTRDSATQLTIPASSISAVNSLNGVDIVVVYTGNDIDENASGTLGITSASPDSIDREVTLITNKVVYEELAAVKFTKQQYVETGIKPGPNTRLEIDMKFDGEYHTPDSVTTDLSIIGGGSDTSYNPAKTFLVNSSTDVIQGLRFILLFTEKTSKTDELDIPEGSFKTRSTLVIDLKNNQASFNGVSISTTPKTSTMPNGMKFGSNSSGAKPFGLTDIILYSLKHYENNVLTHNYLPYTRNGVVGLYDTETNTFISSGTGVSLVAVN